MRDFTCKNKLVWPSCRNEFSSVCFGSCWQLFPASWAIYNEDAFLMMYYHGILSRDENLEDSKTFIKI